jgi:hypothetical protein
MKIIRNPKTDADVEHLWRVFPDILPDGRVVTHEQLEAVLLMNRAQSRYHTVVNRWRKRLFHERGVWLDGQTAMGSGFIALTPDEMVRFGNRGVRTAGRKIRRALAVASAPDDRQLSADVRRYRGLLSAAMERIAKAHTATLREVSKAMAPMKQLPRKTG